MGADRLDAVIGKIRRTFLRPQMLAFLPALILAGYWFGGEGVLTIFAVTFPMLMLVGGLFDGDRRRPQRDPVTGLPNAGALRDWLNDVLDDPEDDGRGTVLFVLEPDGISDVTAKLGPGGSDRVLQQCGDRLRGAIRAQDYIARLDDARFAILINAARGGGMEMALSTAERLQLVLAEPMSVDGHSAYLTASVGFCLGRRSPEPGAAALISAAETALREAQAAGEASIRSFSAQRAAEAKAGWSAAMLNDALERGDIRPWFQPQLCCDTGAVSGMEALARWHHPVQGTIAPAAFLPAMEAEGLLPRLGECMLQHSLSALRAWDQADLDVPRVAINASASELRNPALAERIGWELDRADLSADRLVIEILETVAGGDDSDLAIRNLRALSEMGCGIDLDDFGTGHAFIGNLRRFAVNRVKIDRSFVTRVDLDPEQQRVVSAILSMAERMEVEAVAEGVETVGEHARLAQLGCSHVQGYAIARPMPLDDTFGWLDRHVLRLRNAGLGGALG